MYSREDENEKILVVCSFHEFNTVFIIPDNFDLRKAELILSNYEQDNSVFLKPYETRIYKWKK